MICQMCKAGGKWNTKWREESTSNVSQYYLETAREAHDMCSGCECQHAVGEDSVRVLPR